MTSSRVLALVAGLALFSSTAFALAQPKIDIQNDSRAPSGLTKTYLLGYERGWDDGAAAGREDLERNQGWDLDGQRELETADSGYEPRLGPKPQFQDGYRDGFRAGYHDGWYRASLARKR